MVCLFTSTAGKRLDSMGALASSMREALVACLLTDGDVERWAEERVRMRLEAAVRVAQREWQRELQGALACC